MAERLFVYGTLMRGHVNHEVLARVGARFVAEARTVVPRALVDLGPYPAMLGVPASGSAGAPEVGEVGSVFGEVFEVDGAALEALDAFEGCPDLFTRASVEVDVEGARITTFTYLLAGAPPKAARVLPGGRYVRRASNAPRQGHSLEKSPGEARDMLDKDPSSEDVSPANEPR